MNSRSPCLTTWPSLKCSESMKPETRARTSTVATATNRPVYSSHSVMRCCSGLETVTAGSCGPELAGCWPHPANPMAASPQASIRIARVMDSPVRSAARSVVATAGVRYSQNSARLEARSFVYRRNLRPRYPSTSGPLTKNSGMPATPGRRLEAPPFAAFASWIARQTRCGV